MIVKFKEKEPDIAMDTFIAENASVIGDVSIGEGSSVWFGAVLRGDIAGIRIGKRSNVQDNAVVHVDTNTPTIIGDDVTIGHSAVVHACKIGNGCLIGMGAVILSNAIIGDESVVGAGAIVTENKEFPPRSLIIGAPAKIIRTLTDEDIKRVKENAAHYVELSRSYKF